MGQVVIAGCKLCSYSPGSVSVGGTRRSFRTNDPFPAICNDCNVVTSVNKRVTPLTCRACKGTDVIEYGDATRPPADSAVDVANPTPTFLDIIFRRPPRKKYVPERPWYEGQHLCPKCNQYGFEFGSTIALYD